jgi:hypothetical protein
MKSLGLKSAKFRNSSDQNQIPYRNPLEKLQIFPHFIFRPSQYLKIQDCPSSLHISMSSVTLLHPEETFTVPTLQAISKCHLFQNNPTLLISPYRVQSPISLSVFREFLSALHGNPITITDTNFPQLLQLSEEFGFSEFSSRLSEFPSSLDFNTSNTRRRISALEEQSR